MEAVSKLQHLHQPLHLSLHHHRPSFPTPISSLSFITPPPHSPSLTSRLSIKASSSSSSSSNPLSPNPKTQFTITLTPSLFSLLKTTAASAVAAAAIFFASFNLNPKPLVAAAISPPPTVEKESLSDEERERTLEEYLTSHPDDVQALRKLMEAKVKNGKLKEAIGVVERLIALEPNDDEWSLLKSHMHCYNGELDVAKLGFNEILAKDPFRVEGYHGLVMAVMPTDSGGELKEIEKRVGVAMEMCKREKKEGDLRDFKLLMAQIRVVEGKYSEALKVYEELVKEEPRDFRPYLFQGIIYTLLKKGDEAEKQFQKYRQLILEGHPYSEYLDDNMIATKFFGQKVENERVGSTS